MRASHRYGSALVAVGLLLATACSSDDTDSASGSSTSTVVAAGVSGGVETTTPPETTATPTTEPPATTTTPTTDAPATTTTTTTEPEASGADCLPGRWVLRSQDFFDQIFEGLGSEAAGITGWSHTGGEYVSTIGADGSFLNERLAWQFRVETAEGAVVTTIDSSDLGTYSVEGDQLTISDPGGEATIRFQLEVGGVLQDFPVAPQQTAGTEPITGTGPFTCEGDVLQASINPREESFVVNAVWDRS